MVKSRTQTSSWLAANNSGQIATKVYKGCNKCIQMSDSNLILEDSRETRFPRHFCRWISIGGTSYEHGRSACSRARLSQKLSQKPSWIFFCVKVVDNMWSLKFASDKSWSFWLLSWYNFSTWFLSSWTSIRISLIAPAGSKFSVNLWTRISLCSIASSNSIIWLKSTHQPDQPPKRLSCRLSLGVWNSWNIAKHCEALAWPWTSEIIRNRKKLERNNGEKR